MRGMLEDENMDRRKKLLNDIKETNHSLVCYYVSDLLGPRKEGQRRWGEKLAKENGRRRSRKMRNSLP
jgi:hypothetical protein